MRESRTYGSGRGACHETHVPTATAEGVYRRTCRRGGCVAAGTACPTHRASSYRICFEQRSRYESTLAQSVTVFNGKVWFGGVDAAGYTGLWVTDGTTAGTHEIAVIGTYFSGLFLSDLTVFNNEMLFNGTDAGGKQGLWVTDGTTAGTHEVIVNGAYSGGRLNPSDFTVLNKHEVLFNGFDAADTPGLWETDGTAAGTHEITGIGGANLTGLNPTDLTILGAAGQTWSPSKDYALVGGSGNDFLIAANNGTITGGSGSDAFVFNANFGKVVVNDFDVNDDTLWLSNGVSQLAQVLSQAHDTTAGAVITFDADNTITLPAVTVAELAAHPSDFHFF